MVKFFLTLFIFIVVAIGGVVYFSTMDISLLEDVMSGFRRQGVDNYTVEGNWKSAECYLDKKTEYYFVEEYHFSQNQGALQLSAYLMSDCFDGDRLFTSLLTFSYEAKRQKKKDLFYVDLRFKEQELIVDSEKFARELDALIPGKNFCGLPWAGNIKTWLSVIGTANCLYPWNRGDLWRTVVKFQDEVTMRLGKKPARVSQERSTHLSSLLFEARD